MMTQNDSKGWYYEKDQLFALIGRKFSDEKGELRRVFQVSLHTREELQRIITSEEHLAEFLK